MARVPAARYTTGATPSAQRDLARLMDGYLTTQLLYVAAKLGVADVLADGPRTGAEVAAAVGADADGLTRMLRGLVVEDVLKEDDDGRFALTALGECLRDGVPGSLRGQVLVRGEAYWLAAAGLLRTASSWTVPRPSSGPAAASPPPAWTRAPRASSATSSTRSR